MRTRGLFLKMILFCGKPQSPELHTVQGVHPGPVYYLCKYLKEEKQTALVFSPCGLPESLLCCKGLRLFLLDDVALPLQAAESGMKALD